MPPNIRINTTTPNVGIKNSSPNIRVSNFQTTRSGDTDIVITTGTPIGLLLVLTYASNFTPTLPYFGDSRPNMRIYNN